jgi:hypothetical protein
MIPIKEFVHGYLSPSQDLLGMSFSKLFFPYGQQEKFKEMMLIT